MLIALEKIQSNYVACKTEAQLLLSFMGKLIFGEQLWITSSREHTNEAADLAQDVSVRMQAVFLTFRINISMHRVVYECFICDGTAAALMCEYGRVPKF